MPTMQEIKARLRELGLENEFGYRTETRRIPECLERDETLRGITAGIYGGRRWYVLLTERRLLLLAKPTLGSPQLIEIKHDQVKDLAIKKGWIFGTLTITTATDSYTFTNVLKKSIPSFMSNVASTGLPAT